MNKGIKYSLIMISFGVVITFCLTLINLLTFPIIEKRKMEKVLTYLNSVTDGDWKFGEHLIDISENNYIEEVYLCFDDDENIDYISFYTKTTGYSNGLIEALISIDNKSGKIFSVQIINMENQTKGIGSLIVDDKTYLEKFKGVDVLKYYKDNINDYSSNDDDIISGATVTSKAVVFAVINCCNIYFEEGLNK